MTNITIPTNKFLHFFNSKYVSDISQSVEFQAFRSTVPQRKVIVDDDPSKVWTYYDAGPKDVQCPLVCLPPVSGTALTFFRQLLGLSAHGYRVISVHYPVYWSVKEFCTGFNKLLDKLNLEKVHLFGASLGGFLAQKFVEATLLRPRVQSLVICNSFSDTSIFHYGDMANVFWMMPSALLKRMVMANYAQGPTEPAIADSIDFMVEQIERMSQQELASRMTLNCQPGHVNPDNLQNLPITIIDVFDQCALSPRVKELMYQQYPHAKRAHLKKGKNFPYLSYCDEVNLHLQVHLRPFSTRAETSARKVTPAELPASNSAGYISPAEEVTED